MTPRAPLRIFGINPTLEALRAGTVTELWVTRRPNRRVVELIEHAGREGLVVHRVDASELRLLASGAAHQGVVAAVMWWIVCTPLAGQ